MTKEMVILVTGGCGFIGSNFVRYILKARKQIEVVNIDLLTYAGNLANLLDVEKDSKIRLKLRKELVVLINGQSGSIHPFMVFGLVIYIS